MKKIICIVFVLFMLLVSVVVVASDNYQTTPKGLVLTPGIYKTVWKIPERAQELRVAFGSLALRVYKQLPSELKNLPGFSSRNPCYGTIGSGDTGSLPFVMDESRGTGKDYDILYLDANRDNDFSDAYKVDCSAAGSVYEADVTVPVKLLFPNTRNPNLIALEFMTLGKGEVGWVHLQGFWEGEVNTNKGKVKFALVDCDGDDRYGSQRSNDCTNDMIYFFWNPDEHMGDIVEVFKDSFYFGSAESIDNKLYSLKADPTGESLEVQPYIGPTGSVIISPWSLRGKEFKDFRIEITGSTLPFTNNEDGSPMVVPAGVYKGFTMQSESYDSKKNTRWYLYASDTRPFSVNQGETVNITPGGQPLIFIKPVELVRGKQQEIFLYIRTDKGYNLDLVERYSTYSKDILPVVAVKDLNGKVIMQGKSTFTQYEMYSTVRVPPNLKPGSYIIDASIDIGPFGGIVKSSLKIVVR